MERTIHMLNTYILWKAWENTFCRIFAKVIALKNSPTYFHYLYFSTIIMKAGLATYVMS